MSTGSQPVAITRGALPRSKSCGPSGPRPRGRQNEGLRRAEQAIRAGRRAPPSACGVALPKTFITTTLSGIVRRRDPPAEARNLISLVGSQRRRARRRENY